MVRTAFGKLEIFFENIQKELHDTYFKIKIEIYLFTAVAMVLNGCNGKELSKFCN